MRVSWPIRNWAKPISPSICSCSTWHFEARTKVVCPNRSNKSNKLKAWGRFGRVGEAIRLYVQSSILPSEQAKEREELSAKAIAQLAEAAVARPSWSRIPRLKGEIYDRQGQRDVAVQSYLEAINLGEQNPQLVSRAIFLLFEQGRFVEADEVVRRLQNRRHHSRPS